MSLTLSVCVTYSSAVSQRPTILCCLPLAALRVCVISLYSARPLKERTEHVRLEESASRTDNDPVGENEEGDVGGEGTQHHSARYHHATEDGHGAGAKVLHTCTAYGTCGGGDGEGEMEGEGEQRWGGGGGRGRES